MRILNRFLKIGIAPFESFFHMHDYWNNGPTIQTWFDEQSVHERNIFGIKKIKAICINVLTTNYIIMS